LSRRFIVIKNKNKIKNGVSHRTILIFTQGETELKDATIGPSTTGTKPGYITHVHEAGDLTDSCTSMCAHFNPYGKTHGCPGMKNRHVGDLGNITTDSKGQAKYTFYDDVIKLRGNKCNIIGRGLVIHSDPDDCGQGDNIDSLKTGNSGKRIACAVIGYSKTNFG
jgi:Cu-Zn family superoxide dismutase